MRFDRSGVAPFLFLLFSACTETADKAGPSATAPPASASAPASPSASASVATESGPPPPAITHDPASPPPPKPEVASFEEARWSVTWRLDGKGFAATNGWGIVIHTLAGAKNVVIPKGEKGSLGMALSPKGDRIAMIDAGGVTRVWETATGKLLAEVPTVGDYPTSVAFAPDGSAIAAVGAAFVIWDIEKKAERCRAESSWVYQVVFTDDAQHVLGTGGGHWVKRAAQTCEAKGEGWARTGGTFGSWLDARGRWLSAAEPDGHGLALYEGRTFKPVEALASSAGCRDHVSMGYFSRDGEVLLSAGGTSWFKSFRTSSKKTIAAYDIPKPDEVSALVPFDDGERLYVIRGQRATLVSAVSKEEVTTFDLEEAESLEISPDGKLVAGIKADKVNVRDTLTGKVKTTVELP